jgi:hypothetical protein
VDWLKKKTDGWKTYGTVWSAVLVVLVDLVGWYDVPELEATPAVLGAAVIAALTVTFAKVGVTRDIKSALAGRKDDTGGV